MLAILSHSFSKIHGHAPAPLVWLLILSLYLSPLCVAFLVIRTFLLKESLRPSILARVVLVVAFVLSLPDRLPSSVTSIAPYTHATSPCGTKQESEIVNTAYFSCCCLLTDPCQLTDMTIFDLFQLLGAVSLILYALFVRSQYLRIVPVLKL